MRYTGPMAESICKTRKPGEPYVQCDCYIHDMVAKLLNIRSTRKDGYTPSGIPPLRNLDSGIPPRFRLPKKADGRRMTLGEYFTKLKRNTYEIYEIGRADPVHIVSDFGYLDFTVEDPKGGEFMFSGGVGSPVEIIYKRGNYAVTESMHLVERLPLQMERMILEVDKAEQENKQLDLNKALIGITAKAWGEDLEPRYGPAVASRPFVARPPDYRYEFDDE